VLICSTGFTLKKHYCQHKLENISFLPINGCCKSKAHGSCKLTSSNCEKGCCSNELEFVHFDEDLKIHEVETLSFKSISQIITSVEWFEVHLTTNSHTQNFLTFKPPIVRRNISILFQVFRL
jgi:hypothetical protein